MELYFGFDWLGIIIRDYMKHNDQCLYNALVIKMRKQPNNYLLKVRDSLLEHVKLIESELVERSE